MGSYVNVIVTARRLTTAFSACGAIHIVGRVDRLLALGIGHGEEIAVRIVAELRHAVDGVGEVGDPVQGIGGIDGLLTKRIDETAQPSCGIQHPFRLAIQGIFDRDQIAQFIGERRDVVERIFDRKRLALGIDREGRDLVQGVGDRREIALGVIAEGRALVQGVRFR